MSLIARYRSTFFLGIGFFAIVAHLSTTTVAQPPDGRDARFKRTSPIRSAGFHPAGPLQALSLDSFRWNGGVLSQASRFTDTDGGLLFVTVDLPSDNRYPGYLHVRPTGSSTRYRYRYRVSYADLVPMALFVDSGGTTLYTLWNEGSDRLPSDFALLAGFVPHHLTGMVALEFYGTKYADALYFLDTCQACLSIVDPALNPRVAQMNDAIADQRYSNIDPNDPDRLATTYLNTDVQLPLHIRADEGAFSVTATIARLRPSLDEGRIFITAAQSVVQPEELVQSSKLSSQLTQLLASILQSETSPDDLPVELRQMLVTNYQDTPSPDTLRVQAAMGMQEALLERELAEAFFLFETLALLRSAKLSSPDTWSRFLDTLASDPFVERNPEPWATYTQTNCSLHSGDDVCP